MSEERIVEQQAPAACRRDGHESTPALGAAPAAEPSACVGRHRWISRSAVLAAVGAMTIAWPLSGAADDGLPSTPAATAPPALAAPGPGVVDTLSTGAVELRAATALDADPAAATRAISVASRGVVRQSLECPVQSEANGALGAAMGGEDRTPRLVMPAAEGTYRVTSGFGPRAYPIRGMHEGTDFAGTLGTPLYAVADGTIVYAGGGRDGRSGQIVILRAEIDGATYDFWYGHMFSRGVHVVEGQQVTIGQKIAEIGNNGRSTGPHVHFEVHDAADQPIDPYAFLRAHGAKPVAEAARCA